MRRWKKTVSSVGSVLSHRPKSLENRHPSSSGLGHHPLKVAARVRIPLGLPIVSLRGPSFILSPCVNDYIFTRVK